MPDTPLESLLADFRAQRKRLSGMVFKTADDARRELVQNVIPSLEALAEQMIEVDAVVTEVVEQTGGGLDEELVSQITGALAAGGALLQVIGQVLPQLDDLSRRRVEEAAAVFELQAKIAWDAVIEAQGDDDDDDESDGSEAESGEGEGGEDGSGEDESGEGEGGDDADDA